ncbi:hypothetical protein [Photobacterium minamisatsumaniensis]|uniref:hypothetical protein n=1 Tax=Photobacterium minamisatsumaniensis TaxID=2910233 RepID=UPI003D0A2687
MKTRLTVLKNANVISQEAYNGTLKAVELITQQLKIEESNEQFQMAMTHLARASDRIRAGEPIKEGLDVDIFNEIMADPSFNEVNRLNEQILESFALNNIPSTENSFFLSNLLSLHCATQG